MPFRYLAYDGAGNPRLGVLDVESEEAAERALWDRGLTIVRLDQTRAPVDLIRLFPTFLGPSKQDLIIFTQQLANLVEAGVGIVSALNLLSEEVANRGLQRALGQISDDLRQGQPLSEALEKHDTIFPEIYFRLIEVGERTGNIGFVLRQLSDYLEKELSIARKVRSAMAYPLFLLAMAVGVVAIVVNFTLPPLLRLYNEFDAQLPPITRALMGVTEFFVTYRFHLFIAIVFVAVLGFWYVSTRRGRRQFDRLVLRLPIFGRIATQGAVARLSRSLSTLLHAGVSLPQSLNLAQETVGNTLLKEAAEGLRQEALQGRGLSGPISRNPHFPGLLAQMVRVGEETGTLDSHLGTLADFYEEEVDRSLDRLTAILEPALIIVVGVIVGLVAISVILPMYSLLQNIR
ncbi:MAG: type II secretion system F family protein [Anaerolineales bacterium]|nr:type II secretion system F family protein [Anaerolineales bacterium]